jgi:hypothetical protein
MARYDLPDDTWMTIQPLLTAEGPDGHGLNIVKLLTVCSRCCVSGLHGAIYLNDMVHGKRFIIALTGGRSQLLLTLFSTGCFRY